MNQLSVKHDYETHQEARNDQPNQSREPLSSCVRAALEFYFNELEGQIPKDLYRMVLREVEKPLLETVMQRVHGNQSQAAQILGINRSTLRKKLQMYSLLN